MCTAQQRAYSLISLYTGREHRAWTGKCKVWVSHFILLKLSSKRKDRDFSSQFPSCCDWLAIHQERLMFCYFVRRRGKARISLLCTRLIWGDFLLGFCSQPLQYTVQYSLPIHNSLTSPGKNKLFLINLMLLRVFC